MNHPLMETKLDFDEYLIKAGRRPPSSSGSRIKEYDLLEEQPPSSSRGRINECDSLEVINELPLMSLNFHLISFDYVNDRKTEVQTLLVCTGRNFSCSAV